VSGSWPKPAEERLAEQHLGDRLAALVDGELGHDARERVLAHVATCPKCKAEVDAQRRLKNVFAEAAPPPPSESFLARLQGLPGGGDLDGGGSPPSGGGFGGLGGRPAGAFGMRRGERFEFDYVPAGPHAAVLPSEPAPGRGFRIHDVGRPDADRSASRGRRFAFVAAGAVSLAAIALGGVTTGMPGDTTEARGGSGNGTNVTPTRTGGTAPATAPDSQRRRAGGPLLVQGQGGRQSVGDSAVAPTQVSAPLFPGATAAEERPPHHPITTPVMAGAAAMSPLIRPFSTAPIGLNTWPTATYLTPPGQLSAPGAEQTASPSSAQQR
jgi:hypothetical protein